MHLSGEEKLDLISAFWESLAEHPENIPVPDWQLKELERRIEAQRRDPQPGRTWDEVKREISRSGRRDRGHGVLPRQCRGGLCYRASLTIDRGLTA
jgi:putative addiction module component (TIGR02574 family)